MRKITRFLTNKWLVQGLGILALAVLVWFAGPLLIIPLASPLARIVTIALIVLIWLVVHLILLIRANQASRRMVEELASASESVVGATRAQEAEEVALLGERFNDALETLKRTQGRGKKGKLNIYELPWYIIIGPPGSGKTTALSASGLEFPLADQLGDEAVGGVGGTRNCDWWFTDQAVLLDTAGRYTTQDSFAAVDRAAWAGFLGLLKKHRRRRPINGALIAMGLPELLRFSDEERTQHAQAIRQRIQELHENLGIRFPIYMLFTKCDLIAGFVDFFGELPRSERAQVWGDTFAMAESEDPQGAVKFFAERYDALLRRLSPRVLVRLQAERDMQRRGLVLSFPNQMMLLKEPLNAFLQATFRPDRYHQHPLLRGVYFTSGTQQGTPIDRLMGALADAFNLGREAAPAYAGKPRSYFLNRLLREVVFAEADLTGSDRRLERRRAWLQRAAYAAALGVTVAAVAAWATSYTSNELAMQSLQVHAGQYRQALTLPEHWSGEVTQALPELEPVQAATEVFPDEVPWTMTFGLYQGAELDPAVDDAYLRVLKTHFLYTLTARLQDRILAQARHPEILYELLKVYLMLGDPEHLDAAVAKFWIAGDWAEDPNVEPPARARLNHHLDLLLEQRFKARLDDRLVAAARELLRKVPIERRVYGRVKADVAADGSLDLKLGEELGPLATQVLAADGDDLAARTVPGLYTKAGFQQVVLKGAIQLAEDTREQAWVLGLDRETAPSTEAIRELYLYDYADYWNDLLADLHVKPAADLAEATQLLEILAGPADPLGTLLRLVEENTALAQSQRDSLAKVAGAAKVAEALSSTAQNKIHRLKRIQSGLAQSGAEVALPGSWVDRQFEALNEQVRGGDKAPLRQAAAALGRLHLYIDEVAGVPAGQYPALEAAVKRMAQANRDPIGRLRSHAAGLPKPLRRWLLSVAEWSWDAMLAQAQGELSKIWQQQVLHPYQRGLEGRYPLVKSSRQDANLADFARFFGPDGVLDTFSAKYLAAFVEPAPQGWQLRKVEGRGLRISGDALRQLQYAAQVRQMYFPGGPQPGLSFDLRPLALDSQSVRFELDLDGQSLAYRHGPPQRTTLRWPGPDGGGQTRITFVPFDGSPRSTSADGPWGWFRMLDRGRLRRSSSGDRFRVGFGLGGHSASFELRAKSVNNPFASDVLEKFRCPETL